MAFAIGKEVRNNAELSQHPDLGTYLNKLRDFRVKVSDAAVDLEKEYTRVTGKVYGKPGPFELHAIHADL